MLSIASAQVNEINNRKADVTDLPAPIEEARKRDAMALAEFLLDMYKASKMKESPNNNADYNFIACNLKDIRPGRKFPKD